MAEKSREIILPIAIATGLVLANNLLEYYNIRLLELLPDQGIIGDVNRYIQDNPATLAILFGTGVYISGLLRGRMNERNNRRKVETKEYGNMLSASFSYITPQGNFIIDDLFTDPIADIFSQEPEIARVIQKSVKNTSADNIIAKFESDNIEKQVYSRLAMSQSAMGKYHNTPEEAAEATVGIEQKKVKFIGVLTKEPKFKTIEQEDGKTKVISVDNGETQAETKSKIRLLFFSEELLNQVIKWCDLISQSMPSINVLDELCNDNNDSSEIVDAFIRHMLQNNIDYSDECDSNNLLKHATDRKRFVAMAQVARHYSHKGEDYCVRFSRRVPKHTIHEENKHN